MDEAGMQALVVAYQASGEGLDLIFASIARLLYADPGRFGFDAEDDAAEVVCRFRHRIRRLAARYVDTGSTFEAYITTSLRYYARTMRREARRRRERELLCERAESLALESRGLGVPYWPGVAEDGEPYDFEPFENEPRPTGGRASGPEIAAFKTRLVYLYLKCAWEATDENTRRVAQAAGVDPDWLTAAIGHALRFLETERLRHERMVARRDRSWSRIHLLESRLRGECDLEDRVRLRESIERERRCLDHVRAEIRNFRPIVPNSVVARILGVPKGTVDSGLYYLKKREGGGMDL